MNLKKVKIISIFSIFLLSFLSHFIYTWIPNTLTSFLFPVNESIWEHMKIIVTSYIIYGFVDYIILRKNNLIHNNFLFQLICVPIMGIIIYLIIFLPIYNLIGESMIVSIGLLLFVYILMPILSYYFLKEEDNKLLKYVSIPLIIVVYIIFIYFTYNPPRNYIFYDTNKNVYGLDK